MIRFSIIQVDSATRARRGELQTPHGSVSTPAFMPVGTHGSVKTQMPRTLEESGVSMILGNTYHLALKPGEEVIRNLGGIHRFLGWNRAILTDSGGYQVFSLKKYLSISDEGVTFRSYYDGSPVSFSPERVMKIQRDLGADIVMAFDECSSFPCDPASAQKAVERTLKWAERCRNSYDREHQSLFAIVQGSVYPDLRRACALELVSQEYEGFAVGGLSVGEEKAQTWDILDHTMNFLPEPKPRYLMGVGTPEDILDGISRGVDLFDCVIPTRNGRNGDAYTSLGKLKIKNAQHTTSTLPLDGECSCYTCTQFSRGYLRHLFNAGEALGGVLLTLHNIFFYQKVMAGARRAIEEKRFSLFRRAFLEKYNCQSP